MVELQTEAGPGAANGGNSGSSDVEMVVAAEEEGEGPGGEVLVLPTSPRRLREAAVAFLDGVVEKVRTRTEVVLLLCHYAAAGPACLPSLHARAQRRCLTRCNGGA